MGVVVVVLDAGVSLVRLGRDRWLGWSGAGKWLLKTGSELGAIAFSPIAQAITGRGTDWNMFTAKRIQRECKRVGYHTISHP